MHETLAALLVAGMFGIALPAAAGAASDKPRAFRLNDTGVTLCLLGEGGDRYFSADCVGSGQDAEFGRDSTAAAGSDGRVGFSFAKVCHSGDAAGDGTCPADPVLGPDADQWGCTLDRTTGLLWEVKTADGGPRDSERIYTNLLPGDDRWGDADDAAGFVARVNALSLCGQSDWRVPDRGELHSLVDYSVIAGTGPTIDEAWFPNTQPNAYWTSSPFRGGTVGGIYLNFRKGDGYGLSRSSRYSLRLVQSKPKPAPRFVVSAEGDQVIDRHQRLVWRRCLQGQQWNGATCLGEARRFEWRLALQNASRAGSGWRLPNVKELATLIDDTRPDGTIDPVLFPGSQVTDVWSNTPLAVSSNNPFAKWAVYFLAGIVEQNSLGGNTVRLVRDQP